MHWDEDLELEVDNQKTRCYQTDTLHQLLCDRYGLSYYTDKEKLVELVKEELEL